MLYNNNNKKVFLQSAFKTQLKIGPALNDLCEPLGCDVL
jgi:hypothetical protein